MFIEPEVKDVVLFLFLDKSQIYAIEAITSYLDFDDLKNAEQVSSEWAEIFLNFGMWGTLLEQNVSSVPQFIFYNTYFLLVCNQPLFLKISIISLGSEMVWLAQDAK